MVQDQLRQAYDLIQQGKTDAALAIIEPIIRADRDNRDAWWLMANATTDPAQRRRALNEVLRLNSNDPRAEQARLMLHNLEHASINPLAEVDDMLQASGQPSLEARQGGMSCWRIGLIIGGIFSCIMIAGIIVVAALAINLGQDFVVAPTNYTDLGSLTLGTVVSGEIGAGEERVGYTYTAAAGEQRQLTIESDGASGVPLVFMYDPTGQLAGGTNTEVQFEGDFISEESGTAQLNFLQSGDYLLIVRPFCVVGSCMGLSAYTLVIE